MLKLTKTGIGLLTKQYRSVLRKCLLLNLGLFTATAVLATFSSNIAKAVDIGSYAYSNATGYYNGWSGTAILPSRVDNGGDSVFDSGYISYGYQNITANNTIIGNLEILDRVIGSYTVRASGATGGPSNWALVNKLKGAQQAPYSFGTNRSISENLMMLDYVIGLLQNGTYISSMKTIGDNLKELDTVIGAKIASNGHYIKKSDTNSITANLSALDYALYNYYYTFRVDESEEVTDSASFFQKDFSTLQEVDLHIKNPTHLGAFTKCDEACPRPSERFASSLSQEQMFKNDASVDAGTLSICSLQIGSVNEKLSSVFEA